MTQNSIRLQWTPDEVDNQLRRIMKDIHAACLRYGKEADGTVNYVKGANLAGFIKVAEAMMAQGLV
jgi:glutamate dehydrogenase (NADP+)